MTDDIVTRLRKGLWRNDCCSSPSCNGDWYTPLDDEDFIEAADEIERLRADRDRWRKIADGMAGCLDSSCEAGDLLNEYEQAARGE